jgi:Lipocalin-like domain
MARRIAFWVGCLACLCLTSLVLADTHLTRQQLIGAWRLVRIEFSGPGGERIDPFYQADSAGLIVYDASGWMSCQIAAPHRPAVGVPSVRSRPSDTPEQLRMKGAAFDSYYAYFGSWDFDAAASVVTHHVKSSLIPAENGLNYAQVVTLEGGQLVFRGVEKSSRGETRRTKIWARLPAVP